MTKTFIVAALTIAVIGLASFSCTKEVSSKTNFIFKPAPKAGLAANISGKEISNEDLYKGVENDIYEAEMKVHEIKMNKLRALLLEKLMEADPKKKGLTNDEFLEKHIASKVSVSAKEIQAFIKERGIDKKIVNAQMKERIKKFVGMEKKKKAVDNWVAKQTQKNPVLVYLTKPQRPVFEVEAGDAPWAGGSDAKVTIVEFSDFQCPFCKKGADRMDEVKKKYGKKVKVVFKNFPLPFHTHAKGAAQASLCANEQGNKFFWKLHDMMFNDQAGLASDALKAKAKKSGLNTDKFMDCLTSQKYLSKVEADMKAGRDLGVKSTPTFFVNGKLINGAHPLETFAELIDEELKK